MVLVRDILAFIAPTCLIYAGFAYYRTMQLKKLFIEHLADFKRLQQDIELDRVNHQHSWQNVSAQIEQVRQEFTSERQCPSCGETRQAAQFEQGDYICQVCREETFTDGDGNEFQVHP